MNRCKKYILSMCSVLLIACLLAGCAPASSPASDGQQSTTNQQPTSDPAQSTSDQDPVELRFMWWGSDTRHEATLAAISRYTELHPNVKINGEYGGWDGYYQKLTTQLAGKAGPDLIQMDTAWYQDLMREEQMFVDLNTLPDISLDDYEQGMLDACIRKGQLVGLPTGIIVQKWFLTNLEFFSRHGIDPSEQLTWDELCQIGKQIHAENPDEYMLLLSGEDFFYFTKVYVMQKTGNSIVSDDYELLVDEALLTEAFTQMARLLEDGVCVPFEESVVTPETRENSLWINNRLGMIVQPSSAMPDAIRNSSFDVGQLRLPMLDGAKESGVEIRPAQILSINAQSKHIPETAAFMTWMLGDPEAAAILKDSRGTPANLVSRKVLEESGSVNPIVQATLADAVSISGKQPSVLGSNVTIQEIFTNAFASIAYKMSNPADSAKLVMEQLPSALEELKG